MNTDKETDSTEQNFSQPTDFVRQLLLIAGFIVLLVFLWRSAQAFLIGIAGIVLAVVLGGLGRAICRHTPLKYHWATMTCALLIAAALVGLGFWLGPKFTHELKDAMETAPELLEKAQQTKLGQMFTSNTDGSETDIELPQQGLLTGLMGATTNVFTALSTFVLIIALALFLSWSPKSYRAGALTLFPPQHRRRAGEVLDACGRALWSWLHGQAFAMIIVGLLITVALMILGYPYPYLAGIVAGLLQFIPYIGPFLTAIPVIFLGFAEGPTMALYALLVMTGVQLLESNAITPLVFRHQVSLPPALTLIGTVTMGLVFGPLGLIIGSPLVLLFLVIYRMVYQHDVLGDRVHVPGSKESL